MRRYHGWFLIIALALTAWGCNKSEDPQPEATAATGSAGNAAQTATANQAKPAVKYEGAQLATYEFLEALLTGNDEKTNAMLSPKARTEIDALDCRLMPPASDTAKFTIDDVKYIGEDGAQVGITLTDFDGEGKTSSDKAVWVLRKETEGWRIVGMAVMLFPDEEPVTLNFENPAEAKKKLEEVARRINSPQEAGETENLQAEQKNNADEAVRR